MLQKKYFNGVRILSINKKEIEKRMKKIIKKIKADKNVINIIAFGSFFSEEFNPRSDIDIAIILKKSDKNFIERADDFIDYFNELKVDVNIIVYTQKEFNKMLKEKNNFILKINEGKIL